MSMTFRGGIQRGALLFVAGASIQAVYADQGSLSNSGGSASGGSGASVNSSVASPAGTLTVVCPGTGNTGCTGGTFSFQSNDGSMSIAATLTAGSAVEGCSGGGKGGHITCSWTISAYLSGTLMLNGASQGIVGSTSQSWVVGYAPTGTSSYNSAYSPFYYSDSGQILRSDDLLGTNQIAYNGRGVAFYGAYGIALDSSGRIYVADTYNGRVVRMDNMSGANWTTYGSYGSGQGQFNDPQGIAVDPSGRIYIMDTNNSRLVRIDDMNGTNWTVFANVGSSTGQVATFLSVTTDTSGRIYIPDLNNHQIVRMDDMNGTNWTALAKSPSGTNSFSWPAAVAVDSAGKIYVADNGLVAPAVVRVDDMTGANWTTVYVSPSGSTGLNSVSVDASGAVFTGGGGAKIINQMIGVLTSSGAVAPYGTYYVFGVTPVPLPSPVPSAISLTPPSLTFSQNVGTTSPAQTITIANFGGSPLNFLGITASGAFAQTNTCPAQLQGGSNCTISVTRPQPQARPAER